MTTDGRVAAPDTSALRDDDAWLDVVGRLRRRADRLVVSFFERFPAATVYGGAVEERELVLLVENTMEMYLSLLEGRRLSPEQERLPFTLGRRRAQQGVSLESLLEGVRTSSLVIWSELRRVTSDEEAVTLVRNTDAVLRVVEWNMREVQRSFLTERAVLDESASSRERRAMSRLVNSEFLLDDHRAEITRTLGIRADERFEVALQLGAHADPCAVCATPGPRAHAHELPDATCHVRVQATPPLTEALAGHRVAIVDDVSGIDAVHAAVGAALAIAHGTASMAPSPVTPAAAWPAIAWQGLVRVLPASMLPADLDAFWSLPDDERERLTTTARHYLESGSIKHTADTLYCHRNTIVKRLDRLEALTGLRLSIPLHAALAVLALSAPDDQSRSPR